MESDRLLTNDQALEPDAANVWYFFDALEARRGSEALHSAHLKNVAEKSSWRSECPLPLVTLNLFVPAANDRFLPDFDGPSGSMASISVAPRLVPAKPATPGP